MRAARSLRAGAARAAPSFPPDFARVLPAAHQMRRPADFERAVRGGVRSRKGSLVLHLAGEPTEAAAVVGFVVSKAVGNAVVRNRVKRRLRAVVSHRIDQLPQGGRLVVRALPGASAATSTLLGREFDAALQGVRQNSERRSLERASSERQQTG